MNPADLSKIYSLGPNPNAVQVHSNSLSPKLLLRVTEACKNNSENWHKFIVGNAETLTRDWVYKAIIDFVHPSDFFPVCFVKKKNALFLARNCVDAISKLISNNLVIPNPVDPSKSIRIAIIINQIPPHLVKVNFLEPAVLSGILKRRYNAKIKCLDLSRFHTDPDLKEFCMLSQPKLMLYVVQFISDLKQPPTKIILCYNYIKMLDPLRLLATLNVRHIDLRHNELATIEALDPLKDFKTLRVLKLDGNPLCNRYNFNEYVWGLKQICPTLEMIDTETMFFPNGFLVPKQNFLCNISGRDLVSQFIQHFFTVYDFEDRTKIANLYHKKAIFSVTPNIISNQNTTTNAKDGQSGNFLLQYLGTETLPGLVIGCKSFGGNFPQKAVTLTHYLTISRNLRSPTHCFNKNKFLYKGVASIMKLFKKLPQTVHDPLQLQCDLMCYTEKQSVLVVHGVFQEGSVKLGFTRNFVLQCESDNVYTIVNDQLHVYNALDFQLKAAHKYPQNVEHTNQPLPFYNRQFWELREAVRSITSLNYDYSQRFLETYNYDLKSVICNFLKLYMDDEVPPEAFIESRTKPMLDPASNKKPPLLPDLKEKTIKKFGMISLGYAWRTINEERLLATLKVTDPSSKIREVMERPKNSEQPLTHYDEVIDLSDDQMDLFEDKIDAPTTIEIIDDETPGPSQGVTVTNALEAAEPILVIKNLIKTTKKKTYSASKRMRSFNKKKATRGKGAAQAVQTVPSNPVSGLQMNTNKLSEPTIQPTQPVQTAQRLPEGKVNQMLPPMKTLSFLW